MEAMLDMEGNKKAGAKQLTVFINSPEVMRSCSSWMSSELASCPAMMSSRTSSTFPMGVAAADLTFCQRGSVISLLSVIFSKLYFDFKNLKDPNTSEIIKRS